MDPFIGQISVVAFNYAPRGWAQCNGQLLAIAQNQALYSLLGNTYGGDGRVNFALPDLRGRAAMHAGDTPLGANGGVETVQLNQAQIPAHTHIPQAISAAGTLAPPNNNVWAASSGGDSQYTPAAASADVTMAPTASGPGGSNQPHDNMPPMQVLNFIIALQGIYPSHN